MKIKVILDRTDLRSPFLHLLNKTFTIENELLV